MFKGQSFNFKIKVLKYHVLLENHWFYTKGNEFSGTITLKMQQSAFILSNYTSASWLMEPNMCVYDFTKTGTDKFSCLRYSNSSVFMGLTRVKTCRTYVTRTGFTIIILIIHQSFSNTRISAKLATDSKRNAKLATDSKRN